MSAELPQPDEGELIFCQTPTGAVRVEVLYEAETFWLNQKRIADLFGVEVPTVSYHLKEIYTSGELTPEATLRRIRRVQIEGKREVRREIEYYNLDAFLQLNAYRGLTNAGSVSSEVAKRLAEEHFATFRVQQDRHFESDFEKEVKRISKKSSQGTGSKDT